MTMLPIYIQTEQIRCLIVGGGTAACQKLRGLLRYDIRPTIIAPEVIPEVEAAISTRNLPLHRRPYLPGDTAGYTLVFAATSCREVTDRIAEECRERGILFDDTTRPAQSSFIVPASVDFGPLKLTCTTSGEAPLLAARLKQHWQETFPSDTAAQVTAMGTLRRSILRRSGTDCQLKQTLIQNELAPRIAEFINRLK